MWKKALIDPISVTLGVFVGNVLTIIMFLMLQDQIATLMSFFRNYGR